MRHRSALPRILAVGLAVCTATVGLMATPSIGAPAPKAVQHAAGTLPTATATGVPPSGASTPASKRDDVRSTRLSAAQHRPMSAPAKSPTIQKAQPKSAGTSKAAAAPAAAQSCTPSDFGSRTGSALVAFIQGSTTDCVNTLFSLTGTNAYNAFREAQMVTVANAFHTSATSYPGSNAGSIWQLVLYLRAGYYVNYYHGADTGPYGTSLQSAIEGALDSFVAGSHFLDVSSANGDVLGEVIVLTDSADEQARYLDAYKRVLNAYTSSFDAFSSMDAAVNDVYTPIFRGHQNPAYIAAVTADPSIIDTLSAFARNHISTLSGDWFWLTANAGSETARFLDTPALQAKVRPLLKGLLGVSSITGATAPLWVGVAGMADSYDQAQCSYYGTCDLVARLTAASLPTTYACPSTTITLLAQALTSADLTAVCTSLKNEYPYFHGLDKDNGPIPGQYETNVRLAVYASSKDYQVYSSWIFGNSTDNGGETLTGDPSDPNNSPVSIQYQWATDNGFTARIWNLNHEYAHLLQAIYDMKGDFTTQISVPDVWWIEGQAEYVSYSYRGVTDQTAIDEAASHTYNLSTLFQNTYDIDTVDRTYYWGYLAVRYMFEKHPADIQAMLAKFRIGDYTGGYAVYNSVGTAYDADFNAWLDALANSGTSGPPTACTDPSPQVMGQNCYRANQSAAAGGYDYLDIYMPAGTSTLTVTTAGGSGNADLYYGADTWPSTSAYTAKSTNSGNSESISVTNSTAGWRYLALYANTAFSGVTVTTKYVFGSGGGGGTLPACPSSNVQAMDKNCSRTNQSAAAGNYDYLWIYLPAGSVTLSVTTSDGTGNADLYYNPTTWATTSAYTAKSTNSGTSESLTVTNTTAGYRYISLYAATAFSGVTVSTQY